MLCLWRKFAINCKVTLMPKIQYQEFKFDETRMAVIQMADQIIHEYQAQGFDLTLRQLYYRDGVTVRGPDLLIGEVIMSLTRAEWEEMWKSIKKVENFVQASPMYRNQSTLREVKKIKDQIQQVIGQME